MDLENSKITAKTILKALGFGALMFIALSSPSGGRMVIKAIRHNLKNKKIEKEELMQKFYYLRHKGLVSFKKEDDGIRVVLTENGRRQCLKYDFETLSINKPKEWDGRWRLVFFDIPEKIKIARDALVHKLKNLGFLRFNHSVWIYPYECEKEVDFVCVVFGVGKYVHYVVAANISNDTILRRKFNLSLN